MDLEILFWLVFILAPILSRLFRKNKGKQPSGSKAKPRPQPRPARGSSGDGQPVEREKQLSPFQEALQQIQEAMAEAREEQERRQAEAERAKRQAREPRIEVREATFSKPARKPEKKEMKGYFQSGSFDQPKASPRAKPMPNEVVAMPKIKDGSFYDDEFESNEAYEEEFHETVHSHLASSSDDGLPVRKKRIGRAKWQQAYVMHEILGRPRSIRPWTFHQPGKDD